MYYLINYFTINLLVWEQLGQDEKKKSLLRRFYGYKDKNLKITVKKKIRITVACGSSGKWESQFVVIKKKKN